MRMDLAEARTSPMRATSTKENLEKDAEDSNLMNVNIPGLSVARTSDFLPQILACFVVISINIHAGINMAFSAVLLPQLMTPESPVPIDEDQASWIASIVTIATPVGSLLSGPLMDRYGRKAVCKVTCIPLLTSWIVVAFIKNINGLYCGRLLAGFGSGLSTVTLVYISEIAHATWRPILLCLLSVAVSLGILLTCVLCLWLSYDHMAICFALIALASYIATCYLPESPPWLVRNQSERAARDALQWLYRRDVCFKDQLSVFMENNKASLVSSSKQRSLAQHFVAYKERATLKPIVILVFIFMFQQFSGAYVVIFYAVHILQIAGGKLGAGINEYGALVLLGLIRFVMSIFTAIVSRKCGRRPVSIFSGLGMAISMLIAAIYINKSAEIGNLFRGTSLQSAEGSSNSARVYNDSSLAWRNSNTSWSLEVELDSNFTSTTAVQNVARSKEHNSNATFAPSSQEVVDGSTGAGRWSREPGGQWRWCLVAVLLYVLCSSVGVLVIPWTLVGELLPISVRGSCGGVLVAFAYVLMFGVVKIFPLCLQLFTAQGVFFIFSVTSFLGAVHIFMFLPETRGKSFQEIESYFK